MQENLYQNQSTPLKFKISNIIISLFCGIVTGIIIFLIIWLNWMKPYQIPKSMIYETGDNRVFIYAPTKQTYQQKGNTLIQIR